MSEDTKKDNVPLSSGLGLLYIWLLTFWVFGVALSSDKWFDMLISILFPPYAMLITADWIVNIVNRFVDFYLVVPNGGM